MLGLGAIGAASLAGCTSGPNEPNTEESTLSPPVPPSTPDNEYWTYVIRSLEYQNEILRREYGNE